MAGGEDQKAKNFSSTERPDERKFKGQEEAHIMAMGPMGRGRKDKGDNRSYLSFRKIDLQRKQQA